MSTSAAEATKRSQRHPRARASPRVPQWLRPVTCWLIHKNAVIKAVAAAPSTPTASAASSREAETEPAAAQRASSDRAPTQLCSTAPTRLRPLVPLSAFTNRDNDVLGLQRRLRGVILPLQQRLPSRGQSLLLPFTGRLLLQHGLSGQCTGKLAPCRRGTWDSVSPGGKSGAGRSGKPFGVSF